MLAVGPVLDVRIKQSRGILDFNDPGILVVRVRYAGQEHEPFCIRQEYLRLEVARMQKMQAGEDLRPAAPQREVQLRDCLGGAPAVLKTPTSATAKTATKAPRQPRL